MEVMLTLNLWFVITLCLIFLIIGLLLGKSGGASGRYR